MSKDRTDYRFPLAIYKPDSGKDVEVSARFKPVAGAVDEAGGIAVRLSTPGDYYVARANALEDNVRFYRVVKGKREQLASAKAKVLAQENTGPAPSTEPVMERHLEEIGEAVPGIMAALAHGADPTPAR